MFSCITAFMKSTWPHASRYVLVLSEILKTQTFVVIIIQNGSISKLLPNTTDKTMERIHIHCIAEYAVINLSCKWRGKKVFFFFFYSNSYSVDK